MLALVHLALMLAVPIAVLFGVASIVRSSARRRLIEALRETRLADGETEVRGKLVVIGDPESVDRDGAIVAARTYWNLSDRSSVAIAKGSRRSDRAGTLVLETDDGTLSITDAVDVIRGSRVDWEVGRKQALGAGYAMTMWIGAGESVRAYGKIVDDDRAAPSDYRGEGKRRRLDAPASTGVVRIAAESEPIVRRTGDWRRPASLGVALPLLWLPYGALRDFYKAELQIESECKSDGRCHAVPLWRWSSMHDVVDELWRGNHFAAEATSDADCKRSWNCAANGQCTFVRGECRVGKDEDCARLRICDQLGMCSATHEGTCGAIKNEDCTRSAYCAPLGHCSAEGGKCVAAKDEDCAHNDPCLDRGECKASQGGCIKDPANSCSAACQDEGRCTPKNADCVATRDEDCVASEACASKGRCHASADSCVRLLPESECRDTDACRVWGRCLGDEQCFAEDAEGCRASAACKNDGVCTYAIGKCIKSCGDEPDCRAEGRCELSGNRCVTSDAACKASRACRLDGRCSPKGESCIATRDEDCRASHNCSSYGACTAVDDACTAPRDCSASCKARGECTADPYSCTVGGDEDCRKSDVCARYGWCVAATTGPSVYTTQTMCWSAKFLNDAP